MKKAICLVVCIILIVSLFVGCNQTETPTGTSTATEKPTETVPVPTYTPEILKDEVLYDGDLYKIERINGQCYLIIKETTVLMTYDQLNESYSNSDKTSRGISTIRIFELKFPSLYDFYKAVIIDGLTLEQLSIFAFLNEPEEGKVKVCEFDRIHSPIAPKGFEAFEVYWRGDYYECVMLFNDKYSAVGMTVHSESSYSSEIDKLKATFERKGLTRKDVEENSLVLQNWVNANGKTEYVVYEVIKNDVLYTVYENHSYSFSATPDYIEVYGEGKKVLFSYYIDTDGILPVRDWITEFSVQRGILN